MNTSYDVVVVGSGAAGLSAALTCRDAGLSVLVLEKTAYFGGSTAVSGGAVWIPENPHMGAVGHSDSRESVMRYLRACLGDRMQPALMEAFLDNGPAMVRFMEARTALRFIPRAVSPDYRPDLPGGMEGGRAIDPAPFDGRRLGTYFRHLRAPFPSFLALGGMMVNTKDIKALLGMRSSWANLRHAFGLLGRYAVDRLRWPRGTRLVLGNALAAALLKSAIDAGVDLQRECDVLAIRRDANDRIVGVRVRARGTELDVEARNAVVLASGGFAQNAAMRAALVPHAKVHRSMSPPGNTGDGATLAQRVGGHLATHNHGAAFWAPVSVMIDAKGNETPYPHLVMDRQKPGIMAVNQAGRRFANESSSYHDFVDAMHRAHATSPAIPSWLVCDAAFLRRYGLGLVRPQALRLQRFIDSGYLVRAGTVQELAERMNVPADALQREVTRMNEFARTGVDEDFGRGSSSYNRYLGDPEHTPNPCLGPINKPPFYAVKIWPGDIGSATGIETDAHARVIDSNRLPIAGLYACGNDMNSVMAGTYPSAGITLGPALTFGYIAGKHIVAAAAAPMQIPAETTLHAGVHVPAHTSAEGSRL